MPDLSVIIPIYNTPVEALERCFLSVLALDSITFEVLLIDDGSTPAIGAFCKAFAANNLAFRYHYKENGGASSARNLGLTLAQGRYVTFVDADDVVAGNVLAQNLPGDNGPDVVIFDMLLVQQDKDVLWRAFDCASGMLTREQVLYQLFTSASISGPCAKLYKTATVRQAGISFDVRFISGEDWMFVCDYVMHAQSFCYCAQPAYRYFRDASTGQSRMARFPDKMLHNQLARYARKQQIIAAEPWTEHTAKQVSALAAMELIENLFNSAADLLLIKQYTRERKALIRKTVAEAGALLCEQTPRKTKMKLQVLTRFPAALFLLARLREVYLKRKK